MQPIPWQGLPRKGGTEGGATAQHVQAARSLVLAPRRPCGSEPYTLKYRRMMDLKSGLDLEYQRMT
jgi:hypothetical protein